MTQATQFKVIPGQTDLQEIPRDLRFQPSTVELPHTLSREQVATYNRDGFLQGIRIFTVEEIAAHRQYFDQLLAQTLAAGGDSYSISTAHLKYGPVYDLLTHPRIVACVRDLLGENIIGWGSHYFCKMPGDGKRVAWHQDASYWPLTPSKAVTVWLAIDKSDTDNGCMRVIPGTHYFGHLTYKLTENNTRDVLDQVVPDIDRFGPPVNIELQAGEISLHTDLLLHGSEPNDSQRRRCGLTLRYCTPDVTAYLDWHRKGVMVSGIDPTGNWANPPRPDDSNT